MADLPVRTRLNRDTVYTLLATAGLIAVTTLTPAPAQADNKRLNDSVVANIFTIQRQAGCAADIQINPQLQLAAQWHAVDLLNNRNLDGDVGSDGSTAQDRAPSTSEMPRREKRASKTG